MPNQNGLNVEKINILKEKYQKMRKEDTPQSKAELLISATQCNFLAPVDIQPEPTLNEDGTLLITPDSKIAFKMIMSTAKEKYLLAFTDLDEYRKWSSDAPKTIVVAFEGYEGLVLDRGAADGFVINPFTENLVFKKEMLDMMRKQKQAMQKKMN